MSDENHAPGEGAHRGDRGPDRKPRKGSPREGRPGYPCVDGKLLPQKEAALVMIASGARLRKVAQVVEVSERTITRWLSDEGFSAELAARQARIRADAERVLSGAAEKAARHLVKLAKEAGKEDMAQVKATEGVLDRVGIVKRQVIVMESGDALEGEDDAALMAQLEAEIAERLKAKGWRAPE